MAKSSPEVAFQRQDAAERKRSKRFRGAGILVDATTRGSTRQEQNAKGRALHALARSFRELLNDGVPSATLGDILERLTEREGAVLAAFLKCSDIKAAAKRLGTERQTVRNQLTSIRKKLDVESILKLQEVMFVAIFHDALLQQHCAKREKVRCS